MERLIIYNKKTGMAISTQDNYDGLKNDVITNIIGEVPENKVVRGVNVETKELILEDIPKTETELLQEKITQLENDMADLMLEIATQGGDA